MQSKNLELSPFLPNSESTTTDTKKNSANSFVNSSAAFYYGPLAVAIEIESASRIRHTPARPQIPEFAHECVIREVPLLFSSLGRNKQFV
jgi:hypothetical protein